MSSTGFSGYDHLPTVDSVEIEQLQLSLSAHLDGIQGSIGHVFASKTDPKSKMKNEQKSAINIFECTPKPQPVVSEWLTEDSQYQRVSSSWPKYPGTHYMYSLKLERLKREKFEGLGLIDFQRNGTVLYLFEKFYNLE